MKAKIESLQILRAYAAIGVAICHLYNDGWLPRVFNELGAMGVDVFFVLSGFIMCLSAKLTGRSRLSNAKTFILSRIKRIYPIYLVCAMPLMAYILFNEGAQNIFYYVGNLLLLPSLSSTTYQLALPVSWTLVYEMFFYFVFTAFILMTRDRNVLLWSIVLFLTVTVIGINAFNLKGPRLAWVNLSFIIGDYRLINFVLGIIAFQIYDRFKGRIFLSFRAGLAILVGLNAIALALLSNGVPAEAFVSLFSFALVGSFLFVVNPPQSNKAARVATFIGDASYSIYLTHFYFAFFKPKFYTLFAHFITNRELLINFQGIFLMLAAIIGGCIFYFWVERPIVQFFGRERDENLNEDRLSPQKHRWIGGYSK